MNLERHGTGGDVFIVAGVVLFDGIRNDDAVTGMRAYEAVAMDRARLRGLEDGEPHLVVALFLINHSGYCLFHE